MFVIPNMPGHNIFNGVMVGIVNIIARITSLFLMKVTTDSKTFYISSIYGLIGYTIILFFSSEGFINYLALFLMIMCIGG